MNRLCLFGVIAGLVMILMGCAQQYTPNTLPAVPAEIMTPPCKLLPPAADTDVDLAIDVQNTECVRQLRLKVYRLQDWVRNVTTE